MNYKYTSSLRIPLWLLVLAASSVLLLMAVSVFNLHGLYGDGAYYLVRLISGNYFMETLREPTSFVRHSTAILAIALGITSTFWLSFILSLGYLMLPAAFWIWSLVLSTDAKARFLLVLYGCLATISITWLFPVGELVIGVPCVYAMTLLLTRERFIERKQQVGGLFALVLLLTAHEALILCVFFIMALAYLRLRQAIQPSERTFLISIFFATALGIVWSILAIIRNYRGTGGDFINSILGLAPQPVMILLVASLFPAVTYIVLLFTNRKSHFLLVGAILVYLTGLMVLANNFLLSPYFSHAGRAWIVLATLMVQALLSLLYLTAATGRFAPQEGSPLRFSLLCIPAFCLLAIPLLQSWHHSKALTELREVLALNLRAFAVSDSALAEETQRYMWGWTNPSLSILLRNSPCSGILLPPLGWTPFEPTTAHKQIPPDYVWGTDPEASRYCQTP